MLNIRSDISRVPNPPEMGDIASRPGSGELLMYDGGNWIVSKEPFEETSKNYFRKHFAEERDTLHEEHPTLKAAWDEYVALKKLIGR